MKNRIVLGVDIGGSHITAKLVDLQNKCVLDGSEVREGVNAKGTASEIIRSWCGVIEKAFESDNIVCKKIGIAMPGPFDYEQGIAWMKNQDKYEAFYGLNVKEMLANELGNSSDNIRFVNDAEAFLKGEVFIGAAKNVSRAVGITLGTGLGSARYADGIAEDANLWCSPFLDGIAEDYLSSRWFIHRYAELTGKSVSGVKDLALMPDNQSEKVFSEFADNLALFLRGVIAADDPQVIVLGGNISNAFPLFADDLLRNLKQKSHSPFVKKTLLGEQAALIGAASCWQQVPDVLEEAARA